MGIGVFVPYEDTLRTFMICQRDWDHYFTKIIRYDAPSWKLLANIMLQNWLGGTAWKLKGFGVKYGL